MSKNNNINKCVASYCVFKHSEDIYQLMIDTTSRWMAFHACDDYTFMFDKLVEDEDPPENAHADYMLEVPAFLPDEGSFIMITYQEKDQLSFYYLRTSLLSDRTRDVILASGGFWVPEINKLEELKKERGSKIMNVNDPSHPWNFRKTEDPFNPEPCHEIDKEGNNLDTVK